MFLFHYQEDNLRLLDEARKREERGRRHLRELTELRSSVSPVAERAARSPVAMPRTASYTGPERRMVPCPDMKEAMTP